MGIKLNFSFQRKGDLTSLYEIVEALRSEKVPLGQKANSPES